jgi:hypothetical protein
MIDNLLDSYTKRELVSLATMLGILIKEVFEDSDSYMLALKDRISDKLFDPAGSHHEFNKLAEASDG